MRHYPIFVNLEDKRCLVVGAGGVGKRKIASLLDAGVGHLTIIDTNPPDEGMVGAETRDNVTFCQREFAASDLDNIFLVIACTSVEAVNKHIADLCDERNILCNIADMPQRCSFIVPATVCRGDLSIAISTGGQSPAMARRICRDMKDAFGDEYAALLTIMGRIRPLMLGLELPTQENTTVFRTLVNSDLLLALQGCDLDAATEILKESLPASLHANIPELLDGFV